MKTLELSKTQCNRIYNNMYNRCYNEKIHETRPWYKDCTVCDEWLQDKYAFYDWVNDGNFYIIDGEKTVELDHDILVKGNKIYSPDTCIFVPKSINSMFGGSSKKKNNGLPVGVVQVGAKYRPQVKGYRTTYETPEEAWKIYAEHKKARIIVMADEYVGKIPYKLYEAMLNWEFSIDD